MRTIVKGKNIELPDRARAYAERKLARLARLLDEDSDAIVELTNEQHRSAADAHIAEVMLVIHGRPLRSRASGPSSQAVEWKEKPRLRHRPVQEKQILRRLADGTAEPERERRVVKTKRFAIEPMFEEDAIAEMEELGHAFFLFVNAENERVCLLYRRRDGDYGLIEPIVGGGYTPERGQVGGATTNGRGRGDGADGRTGARAGRAQATRR